MAKVFTISEGLENLGAMKTGGQGSVYKGKRIGEIITAIKILPTPIYSESAEDKNYTSFQSEVTKLKKVNETPNPNVVKILSSGITDSGNFPFIEMEFIEGPDLEELLKSPHDNIFTIKEALKLTDQLSHALAHCHMVDVKHGDIKSNNIKFNKNTANYVLLDFGMAIMSDEQRRTSMRHAGAVEFMAPEQNEGLMLFETDIYGFGVVLFELLAGVVPFPISGMGETARNKVMVAHMEIPPPDLVNVRRLALPEHWSQEKKDHEMHLPEWLVSMIYKCLEKKPEHRFKNGVELYEYVARNSIITASKNEWIDERLQLLQQENERLMRDKEQLQQRLLQYQGRISATNIPAPITNDTFAALENKKQNGWFYRNRLAVIFLLVAILGIAGYFIWDKYNDEPAYANTSTDTNKIDSSFEQTAAPEFKNELAEARAYLNKNQLTEALAIYRTLTLQQIPEAMFQYGNLALQDKNSNVDCKEGFDLIKQAADKEYSPAKRTLGTIYTFADNQQKLQESGYNIRCNFTKNIEKGSRFLMEAMLSGDALAGKLLDELNRLRTDSTTVQ